MKKSEIRADFERAFHEDRTYTCDRPDTPVADHSYSTYPLLCLHLLREVLKQRAPENRVYHSEDDEFIANYGLRFVVDTAFQIHFALEGPRRKNIPGHSDMAKRVYSAGNIYFSEDFSQIAEISNKSGHFLPDFASLVFALPLILNAGVELATTLKLSEEKSKCSIELEKSELSELFPVDYNLNYMMSLNSSREIVPHNEDKIPEIRKIEVPFFFSDSEDSCTDDSEYSHRLKKPRI